MDSATNSNHLPQRYGIKDTTVGRHLFCFESPNIAVHVRTGMSVSGSAARKSTPGTIYIDGVATCEPFLDHEKQIYNFDHHAGCIRPFTLSACEQVLVMILKGMDLRGREWNVFANEPDLDTILAIWLVLNHLRVQHGDFDRLRFLYALIRQEGAIDSHGLEMAEFSGLPSGIYNKTLEVIDYLRAEEIDLKKNAAWGKKDNLEYTVQVLQKIDRVVYKSDDLVDFKELKELARVELVRDRIAVVVEADLGIYEIEPHLQRIYGKRLGVVILKKGDGVYTLRLMDPFMPGDLNDVYRILNYHDPHVRCREDGSQWGGSGDIGGSPRGVATKLEPVEIAQACRDAFQTPSLAVYGIRFVFALLAVGAAIGAAALVDMTFSSDAWLLGSAAGGLVSKTDVLFFTGLIFFSVAGLVLASRQRLWQFGVNLPIGKNWWLLLPVVVLAAMGNGVYFPGSSLQSLNLLESLVYIWIAIPVASELLFRGLAHGLLAQDTTVLECNSPKLISYPTLVSALFYAVFITGLLFLPDLPKSIFQAKAVLATGFSAFALGLANGIVREKSHSILPAVAFHVLAMTIFLV